VDPNTVVNTDSRTAFLSTFNGSNPNATWTLFVADLGSGNTGTVTGWGIEFVGSTPAPVPETGSPTWLIGLAAAGSLWRRLRRR
jgi:MYXO-CTERM domain-containing protein